MKESKKPFKAKDGFYHYVYETTNLINGKKYIGKHSSQKYPNNYIGCGVKSQRVAEIMKDKGYSGFPCAVAKYGYENFDKQIISFFETPEEAFSFEEELVQSNIVKSSDYYNIILGGGNRYIGNNNSKFKGTEKFIKEGTKIHNGKYDYSLSKYKGANHLIKIICPEHGIFEQKAVEHTKGKGCKKCSGCDKKDTEYFVKRARKVHLDKFDYSKTEYKTAREKVKIVCKEHGIFEQKPSDHYRGRGCPRCSGMKGVNVIDTITGIKYKNLAEYCKQNPSLNFNREYRLLTSGRSNLKYLE